LTAIVWTCLANSFYKPLSWRKKSASDKSVGSKKDQPPMRIPRLLALVACLSLIASATATAQDAQPEEGGGRAEQPANKDKAVARFMTVVPGDPAQTGDRSNEAGATSRGSVWTQSGWEKVTANWRAQDGAKLSACQKEAQDQRLEGNAARSHIASCMNRI
jgi:hypothetical protein